MAILFIGGANAAVMVDENGLGSACRDVEVVLLLRLADCFVIAVVKCCVDSENVVDENILAVLIGVANDAFVVVVVDGENASVVRSISRIASIAMATLRILLRDC